MMAARRNNVISITLRHICILMLMLTLLIRSSTHQLSSYQDFLVMLSVGLYRPNPLRQFFKKEVPGIQSWTSRLVVRHTNHSVSQAVHFSLINELNFLHYSVVRKISLTCETGVFVVDKRIAERRCALFLGF